MTAKKSNLENFLFSVVGVIVMLFIMIAIYVISHVASERIDLTSEKLYTLSSGTKAIVKKLDTPVEIRFYCTQGKDMPVELKTYAQRVEDLLEEYKKISPKNILIKKFDPQPDSDAEDSANLDGVEGQALNMGDKVYMGLAFNMLDSKTALPFLDPRRERLLEYDITRAIANVATTDKQVIGVMSALPVFGEMNPMAMRMGQGGRQDPWVFVNELKRDFTVKEVQMTTDKIDDDIKVLVVVHPKGITDKAQYALDQFVLRGGKLIAFLDPLSVVDSRSNPQMNPMQAAAVGGSTLDKLLKAWGIDFDQNKVVADTVFQTRINRGQRPESAPAVLSVTSEGVNTNDVVTSQIDSLLIPFSGTFSGTPAVGLTETVLLKTTAQSQPVEKFMAEFSGEQIVKDFVPGGKPLSLAIRLTGKFKTAFPEGKPKDAPEAKDDAGKDKPATDNSPSLKESTKDTAVILVGDADLLYDQFAAQVQEIFGQKIVYPRNGNLNLIQNMVEQLGGDNNLIAVRSRATMNRPFTRVNRMKAEAEQRFQAKIKELEKSVAEAQTRLNELQKNKETTQRFIMSPEQQQEIQKVQQKQVEVKKQLKQERKNLRREIDSMENTLKWVNIAAMPLLVALSGISLAVLKRKKTAAK
ncbi:MAG: putative transporter, rane protein [Verrucomicrobiales bacterium]|nr:putative transporter, rane protein [Verrucomicrobiales bacterium]